MGIVLTEEKLKLAENAFDEAMVEVRKDAVILELHKMEEAEKNGKPEDKKAEACLCTLADGIGTLFEKCLGKMLKDEAALKAAMNALWIEFSNQLTTRKIIINKSKLSASESNLGGIIKKYGVPLISK